MANQVSHMPLKLASGGLPEGDSLEPTEIYKTGALQDQCQPNQLLSKLETEDVKDMDNNFI